MALRALATRAGEAGRELMGVHTQLHQQRTRVETVETTMHLLQEGFHALTETQDNDREVNYTTVNQMNTIEERQVRILRRLKAFKGRLANEMVIAKKNNLETLQTTQLLSEEYIEKFKGLTTKNQTLEQEVNNLKVKNGWLGETVKTLSTELDSTRHDVQEQNKMTARVLSEMDRITAAVQAMGQRQTSQFEQMDQKIATVETRVSDQNSSFHQTMQEKIDYLMNDVQQRSDDMAVKLRASVKRQSLLRGSVDEALTALATELKASLSMTRAVEHKCESIADTIGGTENENNLRFDAISQAIQALAAVVDDS